ncbi:unnamed protein product [Mytilus edulis]|uniref:Reverse transcriptase domain-containing protein n=1 Tax=Mytilus edulis TaxID=6550 RepID=A0A8S3PXS2_MYTED|nr:unnamed protein product [Mytilus edulis]
MRGAMYGTSYFENLLKDSDICIVTEHWLNRTNITFLYELANDFRVFSCFSSSSVNSNRGSGGVAILVRKKFGFKTYNLFVNNDRICAVKLSKHGYESLCIIGTLLPSTNHSAEEYLQYFQTVCSIYDRMSVDCVTVIGGDFNTDIAVTSLSSKSKNVIDFITKNNLSPVPLMSGRKGPDFTFRSKDMTRKTMIDYIFIPEFFCNGFTNLEVRNDCPFNVSDHYPVLIFLDMNLLCNTSNKFHLYRKVLLWSRCDEWEKKYYQTELDKLLNFEVLPLNSCEINENYIEHINSNIVNVVHIAANSCIPTGKFRHYLKPYWKSNSLDYYHNEQRQARKTWLSMGQTRNNDNIFYKQYKDKKREFRKHKRNAERLWESEKFADVQKAAEMDIGQFYRVVRKHRQQKSPATCLNYDGNTATTNGDICKLWSTYFSDLYTPNEHENDNFDQSFYMDVTEKIREYSSQIRKPFNAFFDVPYTEDEVYEQIKTLKCGKAPGPDYVCNEHIIYGGNTLLKWICYIFNIILKCEYIPLLYRHGIIIPLYKGNNKDKSNPNSYRAIVLTSVFGKLHDKTVLRRINKMLTALDKTFPDPLQFGFVPEHGAIPALYTLKECINVFMKSKSKLYVGFLDNEKAFDKIWHDGLFLKLKEIGVTGKLWNILFMSYKSASAHVQYNGLTSDNFSISQGVGQGRVLSSWLFSLYINDLILQLISTNCGIRIGYLNIPAILLADDTTLLSASPKGLQGLLDCVQTYACKWRLKYNGTKSCVLAFNNNTDVDIKLGNTKIACKTDTIYAGTLITNNNKTAGVNPKGLTPITNTLIWKRFVLPTALYSCEVWGQLSNSEIELLERTQRYVARYIQCMDKYSPTDSTTSNLGLWSLEAVIDKFKLLFFGRLCRSKSGTTHKKLFNMCISQFILDENAEHSITYNLITTLVKYDLFSFLETYVNEDYIPEKVLWSKIVRQSIEIYEENRWKSNLENRNELKRYSKIHPTLCEHRLIRLTVLYPDAKLELLVLVALGSAAIKKATCTLCNKQSLDIVKHLIMECHVLLTERNVMFYKIVDELPIQKSVDIFNLDDDDLLEVLLGAVNDIVYDLDPIDWSRMMYYIAKHVYPMFKKFRHVLFENRFNFEF